MEINTLIRANIRHQKRSFIGVIILMIVISVAVISVLTIKLNADSHVASEIERIGYGVMSVWTDKVDDIDYFQNQLKENENVSRIESIPMVATHSTIISGQESSNTLDIAKYDAANKNYYIYNDKCNGYKNDDEVAELKSGEIYVPVSFQSIYDSQVGDTMEVDRGAEKVVYTIKGFFEDPFMGSALMGIKTVMINDADFESLHDEVQDYNQSVAAGKSLRDTNDIHSSCFYQINIYQKENSQLSYMQFEKSLNKDNLISQYSTITLGSSQAKYYTMILINIFSGVLIGFAVILLIITMVVVGHSISSSIELEYTNIGILKAIGFTQRKLRVVLAVQYLLAALTGMIIGIPISILLIKFLNIVMVSTVGLLIPCNIAVLPCLVVMIAMFVILLGFIVIKTSKIMHVSPLMAICGGREDVYFDSRIRMPIKKNMLGFCLAWRQLLSGKKQYLSVTVITAFLVFFLVAAASMGSWIGNDGSGLIKSFNMAEYDIAVQLKSSDEVKEQEITDFVETITPVQRTFVEWTKYADLDGNDCQMHIISDPDAITSLLSGRVCRYDNEIMVTEFVAKDKKLSIGDKISVGYGSEKAEYMICGFYQCANDAGKNFAMNLDGAARLGITRDSLASGICIKLEDSTKKEEVIGALEETFGDKIEVDDITADWAMITSVVSGVDALRILIYIVAVIFVLVAIALVCGKIFIREKKDIGIYKAIGFTSTSLRLQFAMRFVVVAMVGSMLGTMLSIAFTNKCMLILLSAAGISKFHTTINLLIIGRPVLFMLVVYFLSAYLLSGKIKQVDPRILISE